MNRVFQIVEYGEKIPYQFTSKANSAEGVFRSFSKSHKKYLKSDTCYALYGAWNFGFQLLTSAFWNGKAFIKVATTIAHPENVKSFLDDNKGFSL